MTFNVHNETDHTTKAVTMHNKFTHNLTYNVFIKDFNLNMHTAQFLIFSLIGQPFCKKKFGNSEEVDLCDKEGMSLTK